MMQGAHWVPLLAQGYRIGAAGAVFIGVGAVRPLVSGVAVELVARGAIGRSEQAARATKVQTIISVSLRVMADPTCCGKRSRNQGGSCSVHLHRLDAANLKSYFY